eukprot:SAG11_NODE_7353_length_1157_cov_0.980151_2_plen_121_part_01
MVSTHRADTTQIQHDFQSISEHKRPPSSSISPAEQSVDTVANSLENCPAAHASHSVAGSSSRSAVPNAHRVHDVDAGAEYVPVTHSTHSIASASVAVYPRWVGGFTARGQLFGVIWALAVG